MNQAAQHVYKTIRREGTQASVLPQLQTRDELYDLIGYIQAESKTNLRASKP
jgi:methylisocitrate lyase